MKHGAMRLTGGEAEPKVSVDALGEDGRRARAVGCLVARRTVDSRLGPAGDVVEAVRCARRHRDIGIALHVRR